MGILEYDHASDRNPLKALQDALDRLDELERAAPTGFFNWDTSGAGTSGTIMNTPGRLNVPASYDLAVENFPLTISRVVSLFCAMPQVVAVWLLNGDIERMTVGINAVPLKGFTHIHAELICFAGIGLPTR